MARRRTSHCRFKFVCRLFARLPVLLCLLLLVTNVNGDPEAETKPDEAPTEQTSPAAESAPQESPAPEEQADASQKEEADEATEEADLPTNEDEALADSDENFVNEEVKTLESELLESFAVLHRTTPTAAETKAIDLSFKNKMCAATKFTERKTSLLPHMNFSKLQTSRRSHRGSDLKAFLADVTPLRKQIQTESARRSEARSSAVQTVVANFQSSCHLGFKKFLPEVKRLASRHQIPVETLLAMMTIESGGNCFASVAEGGTDTVTGKPLYSRGLFQIHANFTELHACSDEQKTEIQNAKSVAQLRQSPRCVENPVLNLQTAIKVLEGKAKSLVRNSTPYEIYYLNEAHSKGGKNCWMKKWIKVSGYDAKHLRDKRGHWNRDLWRMAVSAYNGGERWVFRAKRNIEVFNELHGTHVDAYNWDSLKDYYFRRTLNHRQQLRYFGVQERDRDLDYAVLNVIYAENLVPRSASKKARNPNVHNLAELWQDGYLKNRDRLPATLQKTKAGSTSRESR